MASYLPTLNTKLIKLVYMLCRKRRTRRKCSHRIFIMSIHCAHVGFWSYRIPVQCTHKSAIISPGESPVAPPLTSAIEQNKRQRVFPLHNTDMSNFFSKFAPLKGERVSIFGKRTTLDNIITQCKHVNKLVLDN